MTKAPPPLSSTVPVAASNVTNTKTDEYSALKSFNSNHEPSNDSSQPLMIDFNDPSTTNFLLSALASGASSDSNAIVNHLFQKAQIQQQQQQQPFPVPAEKKVPILSAGLKNCTETTNLLPTSSNAVPKRQSVVLHVPSNIDGNPPSQAQQIIFSTNHSHEERKQNQQIFFINNKPYVIQQKLVHDRSSQQRLILTPSITQSHGSFSHTLLANDRNTELNQSHPLAILEAPPPDRHAIPPATNIKANTHSQSTLDDAGNCLLLNGAVEPKTLRTLLRGMNSSSLSGVDNLIDTIHRFEHSTSKNASLDHTGSLFVKSVRAPRASPAKRGASALDKPPPRRRLPKKLKQEDEHPSSLHVSMPPPPPLSSSSSVPSALAQPILVEQQHPWQTDFNSFDFSTPWGSDTNLNSLLLNDDFDTAASFDDVSFGDFEPYMNGNNETMLPSLFIKPLPPDALPSVDHLLP